MKLCFFSTGTSISICFPTYKYRLYFETPFHDFVLLCVVMGHLKYVWHTLSLFSYLLSYHYSDIREPASTDFRLKHWPPLQSCALFPVSPIPCPENNGIMFSNGVWYTELAEYMNHTFLLGGNMLEVQNQYLPRPAASHQILTIPL